MTDKQREEKQRRQLIALDKVREDMSGKNITMRSHLLGLLDLKDIVFTQAGCLVADFRWKEAVEELNVISCMAMLTTQREVAINAISEIEKAWDYCGLQLHPTSLYSIAALNAGRFDLYASIVNPNHS